MEGASAARHAFRVASGLDSMVLGEPQILGQLKQAVREAEGAGTLGTTLQQMFQRSFAVAKEVRSSTEIGQHSISMAAAAVRLASQLFESLAETRVLFVGAGEMIELAATHFAARQPRQIAIANRSSERAEALAVRFGGDDDAARRAAGPPGRVRHRRLQHRELAADHRPGRGRAGAEGAPAPADVHGRPGGAARHRARGGAAFRRLSLHRRRPVGAGADRRREARGGGRPGRGDHRDRRAELRPVDGPARLDPADPGAACPGRRLALARDRPGAEAPRRRRGRRRGARGALQGADPEDAARHPGRAARRRRRRAHPPGADRLAAVPAQRPRLRATTSVSDDRAPAARARPPRPPASSSSIAAVPHETLPPPAARTPRRCASPSSTRPSPTRRSPAT